MADKRARRASMRTRTSAATTRRRPRRATSWVSGWSALLALGVVGILTASFVLPAMFDRNTNSAGAERAQELGVPRGAGVPAGSAVPAFSERDVVSGQPITSESVYDQRTLLFFSEGVMCQACFEQIRDLEQVTAELQRRGIQLISIMPDSPGRLRRAVEQIGITTPVISDEDRTTSAAFNTLGQGMHDDTPGHSFALIERGQVLWYRDYWLSPYQTMYVPPARLLEDIPQ